MGRGGLGGSTHRRAVEERERIFRRERVATRAWNDSMLAIVECAHAKVESEHI